MPQRHPLAAAWPVANLAILADSNGKATLLCWRSNLADHMIKDLMLVRERIGMRRSDIMLVNIAVWVNSEKNLRANISMWADYYKRHKQQMPFVIWRDASVQHFNTPTGAISSCIPAKRC